MTTAHEVHELEPLPATGIAASDDRPLTLAEEHGSLLRQVAARAEDLLAVTADGGWPAGELRALLRYVRVEVLRQAADEERLLFPSHAPSAALDRLGRDHTMVHLMTEVLAAAVTDEGPHIPADLAATTRDLLERLERHLSREEAVLVPSEASDEAPGTTALTRGPHEWFALSEDGVLELDALTAGRLVDAVVDRLVRLRGGERIELHSSGDPYAVWQRMDRACPGDYGFDYLQDGPDRWRVQVTAGRGRDQRRLS